MLKKIDLYIIKKFLSTFFLALGLIIMIVIVFDISEKIDDFLENDATLRGIIFSYYLNFIPYFVNLFSALFVFISVIFFTSKMAGNTEIIALLSSGISFRRILRPYLISACLIAALSLFLANFVIPQANQRRIIFENRYLRNGNHLNEKNIHRLIDANTLVQLETFDMGQNRGTSMEIEKMEDGRVYEYIFADIVRYDSVNNSWKLEQYYKRFFNGFDETLQLGSVLDTVLGFSSVDLAESIFNKESMDFFELNRFIERETKKGTEGLEYYYVEKHYRMASPFSTIVLTIIGLSLASRRVRGGIGLHIGIGIGISFTYILFMQISTTFALYGGFSPALAVWLPNIVFGLFALYMIRISPK
ncbi:MAG: LptF/LptG family permease [Bacteroidetes bacterium]|nr:LptF/LptG family permease [Bacteroidota bacterium]MBU1721104.1 LptF/LptG family permease [Bacteroidota bacterium]